MQTWLVHMRDPARLLRELGPGGFAAFQVVVGGTILSALVHPWFYLLLTLDLAQGVFGSQPQGLLGLPFWLAAWLNLATGYLAAMGVGLLAVRRRGFRFLFWQIPLMPVYWLLISGAAYRACWQFMSRARFTWEKTEHGISRSVPMAPAAPAVCLAKGSMALEAIRLQLSALKAKQEQSAHDEEPRAEFCQYDHSCEHAENATS